MQECFGLIDQSDIPVCHNGFKENACIALHSVTLLVKEWILADLIYIRIADAIDYPFKIWKFPYVNRKAASPLGSRT